MTSDENPCSVPVTASALLAAITNPDAAVRRVLSVTYGSDAGLCSERLDLLRRVLDCHIARFGDEPLRLFRCPGRINLRGMHVDTHGGYLNLMTHQREVVVSMSHSDDPNVTFANIEPGFEEVVVPIADSHHMLRSNVTWLEYIASADVERLVSCQRGNWANYARGAVLRVAHRFPDEPLKGFHGVVGSDIPSGAALSSSASLCLALISATLARIGKRVTAEDLITMAQDAEWYSGSRCGRGDQAAEVLAKRNSVVNVSLVPFAEGIRRARHAQVSDAVRVLVINSFTARSISGKQLVNYTRNRFAYSMAIEIARQEAIRAGTPADRASSLATLADFSPSRLSDLGGVHFLYTLLRHIPEEMTIIDLRDRYVLHDLDALYERYFGSVSDSLLPDTFHIRGPLLFGIAESERARIFYECLEEEDWMTCGKLMSVGHDGDRVTLAGSEIYRCDVSDASLGRFEADAIPIEYCPGAYGASTPALDALVDTALRAGALGACLTGAGMAGVVLALCNQDNWPNVAGRVREFLASPEYARLRDASDPLADADLSHAVVVNHATSAVGELALAAG